MHWSFEASFRPKVATGRECRWMNRLKIPQTVIIRISFMR